MRPHSRYLALFQAIARRDREQALRWLAEHPEMCSTGIGIGATRASPSPYFITKIGHYVYEGDTALHISAAAYSRELTHELLVRSADPMATNRRGAQPLHYACDGSPGSSTWDPEAQAAVVECLISAGADPDSPDANGATPLHRAVRTRCAAAVLSLLDHGAAPRSRNANGSTPLHLAVQGTGRGGVGSPDAKQQLAEIIRVLLLKGAKLTDRDEQGKTVRQCVRTEWVRSILGELGQAT